MAADPRSQNPGPDALHIQGREVWVNSAEPPQRLPVQISFSFCLNTAQTEIHPCWSRSKRGWGQSGVDALSWFMADTRHDFTFRTEMFGRFVHVERPHPGFNLQVGRAYHCEAEIHPTSAKYSIDGELYATCSYEPAEVPQEGWFGFGMYDRRTSCRAWNFQVQSLLPSPEAMPVVVRQQSGPVSSCPVCFEEYDPSSLERTKVVTPCNHAFCYGCIGSVCGSSGDTTTGTCPMCRGDIDMATLRRAVSQLAEASAEMADFFRTGEVREAQRSLLFGEEGPEEEDVCIECKTLDDIATDVGTWNMDVPVSELKEFIKEMTQCSSVQIRKTDGSELDDERTLTQNEVSPGDALRAVCS